MALATPRSRSAGVPRMISPPTLPHPNPSVDTVRPVLPSLRRSMEGSSLEADGDAVQKVVAGRVGISERAFAAGEHAVAAILHEPVSAEQLRVPREPPGEPRAHAETERHRAFRLRSGLTEDGSEREIGLHPPNARSARRRGGRPTKLEVERDPGAPQIGVDEPVGRILGRRVLDRDDRPRAENGEAEARRLHAERDGLRAVEPALYLGPLSGAGYRIDHQQRQNECHEPKQRARASEGFRNFPPGCDQDDAHPTSAGGETRGVNQGRPAPVGITPADSRRRAQRAPPWRMSAVAMAAAKARAIPARSIDSASTRKNPAKAKRPSRRPRSTRMAGPGPWRW